MSESFFQSGADGFIAYCTEELMTGKVMANACAAMKGYK